MSEETLTAELEAMKKKVSELDDSNKKLVSTLEGTEKLIQKWSNEVGENRKVLEGSKEIVDKIKEIDKTILELKEKKGSDSKVSDNIEDILTDEQRELAEKKFQELDASEKIRLDKDPVERKKFLDALLEASPAVPTSLFKSKKSETSSDDNRFRKLFNLAESQSSSIPTSRQSPPRIPSNQKEESDAPRRLMGGVIPRPESIKQNNKKE